MIHEPADINNPCCDECLAWYSGEATAAEHAKCVDCGKCREMLDEEFCYVCKYVSCERGEDCADKVPAK